MTTTESASHYDHLEKMPVSELLTAINQEDQTVPQAVAKVIPQLEKLVTATVERMKQGGRLFYIGAGTSGRLGIVDASECSPTFGVPHDWVIGIMAGGDSAIRKAVEFAEDDPEQALARPASLQHQRKRRVGGHCRLRPHALRDRRSARSSSARHPDRLYHLQHR